jgi:hypothetical protein
VPLWGVKAVSAVEGLGFRVQSCGFMVFGDNLQRVSNLSVGHTFTLPILGFGV